MGLTFVYPSVDDLMVENPFWNGLSKVYVSLDPVRVKELSELRTLVLNPGNSTLLILGPSTPFSEEDLRALRVFVSRGGLLVLADDFGSGNEVLEGFGVSVRFERLLLQDRLFKERNGLMPRTYGERVSCLMGVDSLVLNYAGVLRDVEGAVVLAWSSPFSYVSYEPSVPAEAVLSGPFPVVVECGFGEGEIIVVSDSSLFINSMLDLGDNAVLLSNLCRDELFIDEGHCIPSRLTVLRAGLSGVYSVLRMTEIRYGLCIVVVFVIFNVKWMKGDDEEVVVDEVEELMKRHPEYDRGLLEELQEKRRKARGYQ